MSNQRRIEVTALATDLALSRVMNKGMPLASTRQPKYDVSEFFDLAEAIINERDRRYPQKDA